MKYIKAMSRTARPLTRNCNS